MFEDQRFARDIARLFQNFKYYKMNIDRWTNFRFIEWN